MTPECPDSYGAFCTGMNAMQRAGWAGVDLFFVLSGFLVSGLLFREYQKTGKVSLRSFFVRRGLKIYPGFYFLLLAYGFVELQWGVGFNWKQFVAEALYVQNYFPRIWNHTWTLAIEEHFYALIVIVAFIAAARGKMRWVLYLAPLVLVGPLIGRIIQSATQPGVETLYPSHLRMDSLMFGVILSYWFHFSPETQKAVVHRLRWFLAAAAVPLLAPLFFFEYYHPFMETWGYTLVYLGFGCLLMLMVHRRWELKGRFFAAIAFVGAVSYQGYLWHMFCKRFWSYWRKEQGIDFPYALEFVLYVALTILVAAVLTRFLESPVLRLRDRLMPSRSGGLSITAQPVVGSPAIEAVAGQSSLHEGRPNL